MSDNKEYIVKRVLHAGRAPIDFKDGTKIYFHFQTKLCDKENTIIDDSRTLGKKEPMQIVLGKKSSNWKFGKRFYRKWHWEK